MALKSYASMILSDNYIFYAQILPVIKIDFKVCKYINSGIARTFEGRLY